MADLAAPSVVLTPEEIELAAYVGIRHYTAAHGRGARPQIGFGEDPFTPSIDGAIGELAVAKLLDRFWAPVLARRDDGDLPAAGIEVRTTRRPTGSLIVRPRDRDAAAFFLVVLDSTVARFPGWLYGREAKDDRYRTAVDPPAWFIPQDALRPIPPGKVAPPYRPEVSP